MRRVALVLFVSLLLSGCGGTATPRLDPDVAGELAALADTLAGQLAESDGCAALATADQLRTTTEQRRAEGLVPPTVASEVEATLVELTEGVGCDPPPADEDEDADHDEEDDEEDEEGEDDDPPSRPGRGKGRVKGGGR